MRCSFQTATGASEGWPTIICLDPRARGKSAIARFVPAAGEVRLHSRLFKQLSKWFGLERHLADLHGPLGRHTLALKHRREENIRGWIFWRLSPGGDLCESLSRLPGRCDWLWGRISGRYCSRRKDNICIFRTRWRGRLQFRRDVAPREEA